LADASHNVFSRMLLGVLRQALTSLSPSHKGGDDPLERAIDLHCLTAERIANGDASGARHAMREFLVDAETNVAKIQHWLDRTQDDAAS